MRNLKKMIEKRESKVVANSLCRQKKNLISCCSCKYYNKCDKVKSYEELNSAIRKHPDYK